MKIRGAFDHRLALTIKRKYAVMALICSKLFSSSNNNESFTISYKNCALAWCNKDSTIISIIYVKISSYIEDKILRILAVIYIVLLLFYRINLFYFETINLIFISIIIWVVFLLHSFRLQNISLKRRLYRLFDSFLYQRNFLSYLLRSFNYHLTCSRSLIL